MARPKRENADYFSHDAGMRDDPKVKALRNKFGITGYAVWCMMLEILTNSDFFKIKIEELEIEILSADFGIKADLFEDILSYMLRLKLLQSADNCEYLSQKLTDRLQPVVDKRRNSRPKGVSVTESTQSKVKETKVKETKDIKDSLSDDKSSDSAKWLEKANPVYLKDCENFYNILMEKGKITKSQNWKTKNWHDGFRLLIESDGVDYHKEFKPVMNFYISNIGKQFCPEAYSPVTVRTKWVKLRDYMKKVTPRNSNSNLSARP